MLKRRVLMIAFHYPPCEGSSGVERTLRFSQYLPDHGWHPIVLTVHPRACGKSATRGHREIPQNVTVSRSFALDAARHFSIRGRYLRALALPDRWSSWWLGSVASGLKVVRALAPSVLWSTYPIATAHLIGFTLNRLTRIPWVADFRDPMTREDYPKDPMAWRAFRWIEYRALKHSTRAVFVSPSAITDYQARYPEFPAERFALIENGYDEQTFLELETAPQSRNPPPGRITLVHSGTIYPLNRDPRAFFAALAELKREGTVAASSLRVVLRATGHDPFLKQLIAHHAIGDIVALEPAVSYRAALSEMLGADGLLVLQAANSNNQIPAKLYEYLRAQRPILALIEPAGDTTRALLKAGIDTIAPLDSKSAIMRELPRFISLIKQGRAPLARPELIAACSRQTRTGVLADLLDEVSAGEDCRIRLRR
jgi:hypothetical protein